MGGISYPRSTHQAGPRLLLLVWACAPGQTGIPVPGRYRDSRARGRCGNRPARANRQWDAAL